MACSRARRGRTGTRSVPGLRRYNVSARRAVPTGVLPRKTGQGPNRPSDRPRPAGCRIEGRCLLGGRALPVSHPRRSLPHPGRRRRSDLAPGRRLRIAPSLARSRPYCRGGGFRRGCPVVDVVTLVARPRCCQLPADLHRCAKVQVGDVTSDQTISRLWPTVSACRTGCSTCRSPERAIDRQRPCQVADATGTTTVPVAVTATTGGSSTSAADAGRGRRGRARGRPPGPRSASSRLRRADPGDRRRHLEHVAGPHRRPELHVGVGREQALVAVGPDAHLGGDVAEQARARTRRRPGCRRSGRARTARTGGASRSGRAAGRSVMPSLLPSAIRACTR